MPGPALVSPTPDSVTPPTAADPRPGAEPSAGSALLTWTGPSSPPVVPLQPLDVRATRARTRAAVAVRITVPMMPPGAVSEVSGGRRHVSAATPSAPRR